MKIQIIPHGCYSGPSWFIHVNKSYIKMSAFQDQDVGITAPLLWLATSADRRVSVWSADWSKDFCELVDWLTFPAPAFGPDGSVFQKNDLVRN